MNPREEYREKNKELWEQCEDHLDRLLDTANSVREGDRILLVGPNASGKSLFRKLLIRPLKISMVHASMELRTGNFAHMGALSHMMADHQEDATSFSTTLNVTGAIENTSKYILDGKSVGLHIDEPEIGYSREMQLGCGIWLRKKLDDMLTKPVVTMVTTHSSEVARSFMDWRLIDLGFQWNTVFDWISRPIVAVDPETVLEKGKTLFLVIVERQEKAKQKSKT